MTRENAVLEHRAMEKVEKGRQPRLAVWESSLARCSRYCQCSGVSEAEAVGAVKVALSADT